MRATPPFAMVAVAIATLVLLALTAIAPSVAFWLEELAPLDVATLELPRATVLRDGPWYDGPDAVRWRRIDSAADAAARFRQVFEHGSPAGRLYALAGLYKRDSAAFAAGVAQMRRTSGADSLYVVRCWDSNEEPVAIPLAEVEAGAWTVWLRQSGVDVCGSMTHPKPRARP